MIRRRKPSPPEIINVGYGGLCSECDVVHEPDPCPFSYTVGLTERGWPELMVIAPKADVSVAPDIVLMINQLVAIAEKRGRAFKNGDRVHGAELSPGHCADFTDAPEDLFDDDCPFPAGVAIRRYGVGGFRLLLADIYGLPYWLLGVPQDEIEAALNGDARS